MSARPCKRPCKPYQICNPMSGRCVSRTGKIGKKIRSRSIDKSSRKRYKSRRNMRSKSSKNIRSKNSRPKIKTGKLIQKASPPFKYTSMEEIGAGANATVYLLCNAEHECRVRKVMSLFPGTVKIFEHEIAMHKKFEQAGLAPKLYRYGRYVENGDKYGFIEMDLVSGTFYDLLKAHQSPKTLEWIVSSVNKIIDQLCEHRLIHGDAHLENFAYNNLPNGEREALLIDFGRSCCIQEIKCNKRLEYQMLLTNLPYSHDITKNNLEYIERRFTDIYNRLDMDSSMDDYNQRFRLDLEPLRAP